VIFSRKRSSELLRPIQYHADIIWCYVHVRKSTRNILRNLFRTHTLNPINSYLFLFCYFIHNIRVVYRWPSQELEAQMVYIKWQLPLLLPLYDCMYCGLISIHFCNNYTLLFNVSTVKDVHTQSYFNSVLPHYLCYLVASSQNVWSRFFTLFDSQLTVTDCWGISLAIRGVS